MARAKGRGPAGRSAWACRACSAKLGALEAVEKAGVPLLDDMGGHPGVAGCQQQGYTVLIF